MAPLRISLFQTDIVWEDKQENLRLLKEKLITLSGSTDLVVLPEMFSTGFSMNSRKLAEPNDGETITVLKQWATDYELALAGSYIASEGEVCYNRCFFITPQQNTYFYDKHHLFTMGEEPTHFEAGNEKVIVSYLGWKIRLIVCYDLRFPVWCCNVANEYDLLLVVANWPFVRSHAWETLLMARAIENQSYVCGVNRIGEDANGLLHSGQSVLVNAKGQREVTFMDGEQGAKTIALELSVLQTLRSKFPTWKDADEFSIQANTLNY